jgi:hypothetical protein
MLVQDRRGPGGLDASVEGRSKAMNAIAKASRTVRPIMTPIELAKLGGGEVAYIKQLTSEQATEMFPAIKGLPKGIDLFALHAADGTPLALTDTRDAAIGHALEDDLKVASVH